MKALRRFRYWHEAVLVFLLATLLAFAYRTDPKFLALASQVELSAHGWELALLAIPMLLIVITGGIDLSVGSGLALCAVVLGLAFKHGYSPWVGAGLAVLTGTAMGALNGVFIAKVRVHPLIVTLATLAAFRGIAQGISLAVPVSGFPDSFLGLSTNTHFGLPAPGWLFVLCLIVVAVVLGKTPLGRSIYAIGHNETAARFSGLKVDRIKLLVYTLAGCAAGLAATPDGWPWSSAASAS